MTSYLKSYLTSYLTSYVTSYVTSCFKASVDGANMAVRLALNLRDELIEQYFKIRYIHAEILS